MQCEVWGDMGRYGVRRSRACNVTRGGSFVHNAMGGGAHIQQHVCGPACVYVCACVCVCVWHCTELGVGVGLGSGSGSGLEARTFRLAFDSSRDVIGPSLSVALLFFRERLATISPSPSALPVGHLLRMGAEVRRSLAEAKPRGVGVYMRGGLSVTRFGTRGLPSCRKRESMRRGEVVPRGVRAWGTMPFGVDESQLKPIAAFGSCRPSRGKKVPTDLFGSRRRLCR